MTVSYLIVLPCSVLPCPALSESWMVCEHHARGFEPALLGETFSYATLGNGMVAVLAGLIANYFADMFGYVAPFVVAMAPLSVVGLICLCTWGENYGNKSAAASSNSSASSSLMQGFELIRNDSRVAALGLSQSLFEGAMYVLV